MFLRSNEVKLRSKLDVHKSTSSDDLDTQLKQGKQYVLLDNLILDVTHFITHHPGGSQSLKRTIGKDISKYFFGGYSLEGNLTNRPLLHSHSNYAIKIVNDLVVAVLDRNAQHSICEMVR